MFVLLVGRDQSLEEVNNLRNQLYRIDASKQQKQKFNLGSSEMATWPGAGHSILPNMSAAR